MDVSQSYDALVLAKKILAKKTATINSGIYGHLCCSESESDDEKRFDVVDDIIVIKAKTNNGITISDIMKAFAKMTTQFNRIDKSSHGDVHLRMRASYMIKSLRCVASNGGRNVF